MSGIVLDRTEDRPYGPGNPDYEYDKWRDEMDEKLTDAEREFEEWWTGQMKGYDVLPSLGTKAAAKAAYFAADAHATKRTARRCREICGGRVYAMNAAISIAKEFGL